MSGPAKRRPGPAAVRAKGWWRSHRWLVARRVAQAGFLALFLSGPLAGLWIARGTLASSETLGLLPLTDPLVLLQSLLAGHAPAATALAGGALVLAVYALLRGRLYCAWVCPVNPVTDAAAALRRRLGLKEGTALNRRLRLWVLAAALVASAAAGVVVWEAVNPVTLLHRALVFGGLVFGSLAAGGAAWSVVAALFLFDLAVAPRGWCGHLCPVGAFYGQLGRFGRLAVTAPRRAACDHCMDCYQVCPEPQVIAPALNGPGAPTILSPDCTACGRCIDVCPHDVFAMALRLPRLPAAGAGAPPLRQGEAP